MEKLLHGAFTPVALVVAAIGKAEGLHAVRILRQMSTARVSPGEAPPTSRIDRTGVRLPPEGRTGYAKGIIYLT